MWNSKFFILLSHSLSLNLSFSTFSFILSHLFSCIALFYLVWCSVFSCDDPKFNSLFGKVLWNEVFLIAYFFFLNNDSIHSKKITICFLPFLLLNHSARGAVASHKFCEVNNCTLVHCSIAAIFYFSSCI